MRTIYLLIFTLLIVFLTGCASKANPTVPDDDSATQVNLYPVKAGSLAGYIESSGKSAIGLKFRNARDFSEGFAPVERVSVGNPSAWGYINKKGTFVIKPQFNDARPFSNGVASVLKTVAVGRRWGFIDKTGKFVIPPTFENALDFSEEVAWVKSPETNLWGLINKSGNYITKPNLGYVECFSEGCAVVGIEKRYGYVDTKGTLLIPLQYTRAYRFKEGLALIQVGSRELGKYGFINKEGKVVIEPKYYEANNFSMGFAPVRVGDGKYGPWAYIDKNGKEVIKPLKVGWAGAFSDEGLAPICTQPLKQGGYWGFIDTTGKVVIEPQFRSVNGFIEGGICQVEDRNGNMAYIDKTGYHVWNEEDFPDSENMFKSLSSIESMRELSAADVSPLYVILVFSFALLFYAGVLFYAATYIGIDDVTFMKCFAVGFCEMCLNSLVGVFFRNYELDPGVMIFTFLLAVVIGSILIKLILNTEWGRAILTYFTMLIMMIILGCGLILCGAGCAGCLIPR